jgi:hypothetical protein
MSADRGTKECVRPRPKSPGRSDVPRWRIVQNSIPHLKKVRVGYNKFKWGQSDKSLCYCFCACSR